METMVVDGIVSERRVHARELFQLIDDDDDTRDGVAAMIFSDLEHMSRGLADYLRALFKKYGASIDNWEIL